MSNTIYRIWFRRQYRSPNLAFRKIPHFRIEGPDGLANVCRVSMWLLIHVCTLNLRPHVSSPVAPGWPTVNDPTLTNPSWPGGQYTGIHPSMLSGYGTYTYGITWPENKGQMNALYYTGITTLELHMWILLTHLNAFDTPVWKCA